LLTISMTVALGAAGIVAYQAASVSGAKPVATKAPTKGPIPENAWRPDGTVDRALLPDFVSALGRDGTIAGYVPSDKAVPDSPSSDPIAVFGDDLETVVGYMYPGRGFVPLGADYQEVPELPVETPSSPDLEPR
jgi:hypothetical protein